MKNYYEIGALHRREFRSLLKRLKFIYEDLTWEEDRGWIESIFYVSGNLEAILRLNSICDEWSTLSEPSED